MTTRKRGTDMVFPAAHCSSRLEFRRDMSHQNAFPDHLTELRDMQNTVALGLVYAFSSGDAKS
jgi:hypothetical protein